MAFTGHISQEASVVITEEVSACIDCSQNQWIPQQLAIHRCQMRWQLLRRSGQEQKDHQALYLRFRLTGLAFDKTGIAVGAKQGIDGLGHRLQSQVLIIALAILGIFGEEKTGENFESKAILVACHKGRCLRTPWLLKVQIHSDRTATVVQVAVDLHERRCDRKGFTMKIRLQNNIHQKSHGF